MSTARSLLALACCCTSAAAAAQSAAELELELAREPAHYLRVDPGRGVLQVMIRGLEVDRVEPVSVLLITERAAGQDPTLDHAGLPAAWRVAAEPEVPWRRVVAPPTLVPYDDDAPPLTPAPTATPPPELPGQYRVELEGGWSLHLGPDPPGGLLDRLVVRIASGWRRLTGRSVPPDPPAIVIRAAEDDSRRMLHLLRKGTAILVLCTGQEGPGDPGTSSADPSPRASTAPPA